MLFILENWPNIVRRLLEEKKVDINENLSV
jgi:hypothetical protein